MKTRFAPLALLSLLLAPLAFAAGANPSNPLPEAIISREEIRQGFRNGSILAKPRAGYDSRVLEAAEAKEGITIHSRFGALGGLRIVRVAKNEKPDQLIARLVASGRYEYVERDYVLKALAVPNDPKFSDGTQWSLSNSGAGGGTPGADVAAVQGWDTRTDASSVVVAVVDTGVLLTHEDLAGNLWTNPTEIAGNGKDDDGNSFADDINGINTFVPVSSAHSSDPTDDNGHGTAVASVIAAVGNNGKGMTGIAWKAKIMAVKVADQNGFASISSEVAGFDYAVAKGAKIINFSFGGHTFSQASNDAIKRCRDAGVIMALAAGNDGVPTNFEPSFPGANMLDNIVTVAASDRSDALTSFSNYGAGMVDIAAPGRDLSVADYIGNDRYKTYSGTSFSAPLVAGALALIKAQFPGENYRATINRLLNSVDKKTNLAGAVASGGRLNLAKALTSSSIEPANDRFANAVVITDYSTILRGSSTNATVEPGRPSNLSSLTNPTLWWTWKPGANVSGTGIIDTEGSDVDTIVTVYSSGSPYPSGASIASNDDYLSKTSSHVTFSVLPGNTYAIAISSKNNTKGLITAALSVRPPNDRFTDAVNLGNATDLNGYGFNRLANRDTSEAAFSNSTDGAVTNGNTVWYSWTAPSTGRYAFSIYAQGFDGVASINTGTTLTSLSWVANASVVADVNEPAEFNAAAGTKYYIGVDSVGGRSGFFAYSMSKVSHMAYMPGTVYSSPSYNPANSQVVVSDEYGILISLNFTGTGVMLGDASYMNVAQLNSGLFLQSPSVLPDGSMYIGDDRGYLYKLTGTLTTERQIQLFDTSLGAPLAIGSDGTIFAHSDDGYLHAYNKVLEEKWKIEIPGSSSSAPSINQFGTIFIGSTAGKLYAVEPAAGTILWTYDTGSEIATSPAIDAAGNIYFGNVAGSFYVLNKDGVLSWQTSTGSAILSSAALDVAGNVYFGNGLGSLHSYTPGGSLRWKYDAGDSISISSPAIDANGVIYVGSWDGFLHAVNNDGTLKHKYAVCRGALGSPMIAGSAVYFGGQDHRAYSVDIGAGPAASAWPMYRQNARHTGRAIQSTAPTFTLAPLTQTVGWGSPVVLAAHAEGSEGFTFQWYKNGNAISEANQESYRIPAATQDSSGLYTVVVTNSFGSTTSSAATLTVGLQPPVITEHPGSVTQEAGTNTILSVSATGEAMTYQWYKNDLALTGQTGQLLPFTGIQNSDAGEYTVKVANSGGTTVSRLALLRVETPVAGRLINVSVRSVAGHDGSPLIVGFVVADGTKKLLVRTAGPILTALGVTGTLEDPKMDLYDSGSNLIASNDNWGDGGAGIELAPLFQQVGAFAFPENSKDAAFVYEVGGAKTVIARSVTGGLSGVVLIEAYDTATDSTPRLRNVSARNYAGTGSDTLIAGFVINGNTPKRVLIRGVGPTLAVFGVGSVLADPKLELHWSSPSGDRIFASNDNWNDEYGVAAANGLGGAFDLPSGTKDSALVVTLPAGQYTAQVTGVNYTTGNVLVEVYDLTPSTP